MIATDFESRLAGPDLTLFSAIASQSTEGDRRSWLAVQRAMRRNGYRYLEIGSHLGGSIQQHLVDPLCISIVSIDKRPLVQPDDRGRNYDYEGNSTARMLDNLRRIAPGRLDIIQTHDCDASEIAAGAITPPPDMCFIDGQHTGDAVLSDFAFCRKVASPDAAILFHDDYVTHRALATILRSLRAEGVRFRAAALGGWTFAIFLGNCPAADDPAVKSLSRDADAWLRRQRVRAMMPQAVQPAVRWAAVRLGLMR